MGHCHFRNKKIKHFKIDKTKKQVKIPINKSSIIYKFVTKIKSNTNHNSLIDSSDKLLHKQKQIGKKLKGIVDLYNLLQKKTVSLK
ncbi:hypothetical protein FLJU110815_03285 [Flavobacterium jumunjinense]